MANKFIVDHKIPVIRRGVKRSFGSIRSYDLFMEPEKYRIIRKSPFIKTLLEVQTKQELATYLLSVNFAALALFEGNVYGSGRLIDEKTVDIMCLTKKEIEYVRVQLPNVRNKTVVIDTDSARAAIINVLNNVAMIHDRSEYQQKISSDIFVELFRYTLLPQPKRVVKEELNRLKQRKFISILENGNNKPSLVSLFNDEPEWTNDDIAKLHLGDPQF